MCNIFWLSTFRKARKSSISFPSTRMSSFTKSAHVARKIGKLNPLKEGGKYLTNRNPRNLEKLCIARKPDGYHLDSPGRKFWNKLVLESSNKYITARVVHHLNGTIVDACSSEWAIKKQLYRTTDTSAYVNVAKVLALRCQEMGLSQVECFIRPEEGSKTDLFLKTLESCGISLKEGERFSAAQPWDTERPEKPWEVL